MKHIILLWICIYCLQLHAGLVRGSALAQEANIQDDVSLHSIDEELKQLSHEPFIALQTGESMRHRGIADGLKILGAGAAAIGGKTMEQFVNSPFAKALVPSINPTFVIEDCFCCQLVWKGVESKLGNGGRYGEDIRAAYQQICMEVQQAAICYPAVNKMGPKFEALEEDYKGGLITVGMMCAKNGLCGQ